MGLRGLFQGQVSPFYQKKIFLLLHVTRLLILIHDTTYQRILIMPLSSAYTEDRGRKFPRNIGNNHQANWTTSQKIALFEDETHICNEDMKVLRNEASHVTLV
jgi:hypothetical protein